MRLQSGSSSRAISSIRHSTAAVLCLALVVTCPAPALTQSRFDSWTTENGLPQNSIRDILQTRDGYLWLAAHSTYRDQLVRRIVISPSTPS